MNKTIIGTVVSNKMAKTLVVIVEEKKRHPKYRKVMTNHKKYKAHYEGNDINIGDLVVVVECRPVSKDVHFMFAEKLAGKQDAVAVISGAKKEGEKEIEKKERPIQLSAKKKVKKEDNLKKIRN